MLKVEIVRILHDNYSYIIYSENSRNALIIDTTTDTQSLIDAISRLNVRPLYILNTHHHHDHIGGNDKIKELYNCKIVNNIVNKKYIDGINIVVKNVFTFEGIDIFFIDTPGHAFGHVVFYIPSLKWLFSGDILFSVGCGRIFEGSFFNLFYSISKISSLPDDTKIFFGHEYTMKNVEFALQYDIDNKDLLNYKNSIISNINILTTPSTLGIEKKINPFLRCDEVSIKNFLGVKDSFEAFKKLRVLRNIF